MVELVVGKYYELEFYDKDGNIEVEEFLDGMKENSGVYRLLGGGRIGYKKYFLFKHADTDNVIEVDEDFWVGGYISYHENKFKFHFYSDQYRENGEYVKTSGPDILVEFYVRISDYDNE